MHITSLDKEQISILVPVMRHVATEDAVRSEGTTYYCEPAFKYQISHE